MNTICHFTKTAKDTYFWIPAGVNVPKDEFDWWQTILANKGKFVIAFQCHRKCACIIMSNKEKNLSLYLDLLLFVLMSMWIKQEYRDNEAAWCWHVDSPPSYKSFQVTILAVLWQNSASIFSPNFRLGSYLNLLL